MESIGNSINLKCDKDMRSYPFPNLFDWIKAAKVIDENNIQNASIALGITIENPHPILKNGKPFKSADKIFEYEVDNPVLIDDDTGQIINCFSHVDSQSKNKSSILPPSYENRLLLRWPKKAIDILTNSFYYKLHSNE
jgi:hypothetical protein